MENILQKNYYLLLLVIIASLYINIVMCAGNPNGMSLDRVEIFSVSTDTQKLNDTPRGSIKGGTMLHIIAKGHNITPSKNKVFIGPYPCIIHEKGISGNKISCITTPQTEPDRFWELPVELHVENKVQSICRVQYNKCVFTYDRGYTPYLRWIIPGVATPNTMINWNAYWRVSRSSEVTKMIIGGENCNRYELQDPEVRQTPTDLNYDAPMTSRYQSQILNCQTSQEQAAGIYVVSIESRFGNLYKYPSSTYVTADGQKEYDFVVTADIKEISSNVGSEQGNRLEITGQGFGKNITDVQVKVGSQDCEITELNNKRIVCELGAGTQPSQSAGKFIHGQGLIYTEYDLNSSDDYEKSTIDNPNKLRTAIEDESIESGRIKEQKIQGSWEAEFPPYSAVHMKGYFKAPRTGLYKFWISSDDSSELYLNQNPLTSHIQDSDKIAEKNSHSYQRNYFTPNGFTRIQENGIQLEEGKYYWMEAFAYNGYGAGHLTISVEAPALSDGSYAANSVSELQYFRIIPNKDSERWRFKVYNQEKYNIFNEFVENWQRTVNGFVDQNDDGIAWDSLDAEGFVKEIGKVFEDNPVLVESFDLDGNGNRCSGDCIAQGMEIVFEFQNFRDPQEVKNAGLQCWQCEIQKIQDQSSGLSGTFTMQLIWESKGQERTEFVEVWKDGVGWNRDIPFDASSGDILSGLIRLDSRFGSTQARHDGHGIDGRYFEFHFMTDDVSFKGDIKNFVVDVSNIQGGKGSHSIEQGEKITASKNLFYEPIPFDMSFVKADKPSVLVTVNEVLSRCSGDCTYQTSAEITPELTTFSETSKTLTLGITVPAGLTIPISDLEITFGNYPCDASSGGSDITNFTCTVEGIEAGDHLPKIYAKGVGYIKHSSSLSPLNQGIALSGLSPASGSINGGKEVTITGTGGFPKAENIDNLVVKFGDVVAHVKSTSDTSIVVDIPSSQTGTGDVDVTIEYSNNTSDSQSFTYSDTGVPTITSIEINDVVTNFGSKAEVNPVKKQTIKIVGTNFEDEKTSVWLLNKETDRPVYNVNVNSVNSDGTEITATLSGGKVGEYNLIVKHEDYGNSVQKIEFDYIIKITNIDLTQGPKQGGPKITITGVNFGAQIADNQVFFEQQEGALNVIAQIESCTTSEIVARIPKMPSDGDINSPFTITVMGRVIEKGTCKDTTNNCQFTYIDDIQVPFLTESQFKEVKNGDSIELEGQHLPTTSDSAFLIIQDLSSPIPLTLGTQTKFAPLTIPNTLSAGQHIAQIKLESYGVIGAFFLDVQLEISKILPETGINIGGGEITIQGSGFSQSSKFLIGNYDIKEECIIKTFSSHEVTCIAPANSVSTLSVTVEEPSRDSESCINCLKYIYEPAIRIQFTTPSSDASILQVPPGPFNFQAELSMEVEDSINVYFQSKENKKMRLKAGNIIKDGVYITATFNEIIAGSYDIQIEAEGKGFSSIPGCKEEGCVGPIDQITFELGDMVISSGRETGLGGGSWLQLTGKGFNTIDAFMNEISVCGHPCRIDQEGVSSTGVRCELPGVNTMFLFDEELQMSRRGYLFDKMESQRVLLDKFIQRGERKGQKYFKKITTNLTGDRNVISDIVEASIVNDENRTNEFIIEFEARENSKVFIEKIVLDPGNDYDMENYFGKVKLQGRNAVDDAWVDLDTFTSDHLSDYQEVILKVEDNSYGAEDNRKSFIKSKIYKFYRIVETQERDNKALCELFIKKITGIYFYEQDITTDEDFNCEVIAYVNGQSAGIQGGSTVTYKGSVATARVTDISPQFSTRIGSDQITISGSNFGTDRYTIKVFIDGQECVINSVSDGQIVFTTPASIVPVAGTKPIEVTLNDVPVLMKKGVMFYSGALRWSHEDTWGGESLPRDKHFAVVPKGETLVVDMSTPILNTLLVEGTVLFDSSLNLDIEVKAEYIIVREGQFIAGTKAKPYTGKLTITLYGNYWGKQLPDLGNKVLACHNCQIDIHAAKKGPHFALLKETVYAGDSTLKLSREVDWQVDDFIGISTTDYNGEHSEKMKITSIISTPGSNESTIEFTPKLKYTHIAEEEDFGSKTLKNYAEVILLSSNILIRGDPDDSEQNLYGGHLIVHGKTEDGTIARIDGVEFQNTGQPRIVGRYTCHFHMLGDSPNSYVRNIKVHNAFARVVAIHATNYLRVQNNVGFYVPGHNIFLEDGVETNNIIEGNVLISPRSSFTMLQTDVTVAGIWITNPSNIVRYNIVSGSQFYGLWYEIKDKPESRTELCPEGMPVLQLEHNIGHSNQRYGLRFFRLQPRTFPCRPTINDWVENPFQGNPSIQYTYRNQSSWKNGESGILAEYMGDSIFEDCIMADSFRTGFQAHVANYTENPVVLRDSLIVGKSTINGEVIDYESSAILVPRTSGFKAENVDIYNMPEGTNIIESSSDNQWNLLWTQGGHQNDLNRLNIQNSNNAKKLKWQGPSANLIFDEDGSLTGKNVPTWITPYRTHFDKPIAEGLCERNQELYDDSVVCTIPLRAVKFGNMVPKKEFLAAKLRIFNVNDETKTFDIQNSDASNFGEYLQVVIKNPAKDMLDGFAAVMPVGYVLNVHWTKGIEWDHTLVYPSYESDESDKNFILRFPYWEQRELFEVFRMVANKLVKFYNQKSDINKFIDPVTKKAYEGDDKCSNGDWIQDDNEKFLYLCISGKGRDGIKYQQIDLNGVYCRDSCEGGFQCEREKSYRPFMPSSDQDRQKTFINESQGAKAMAKSPGSNEWEFREPQEGDDVRIPCEFMMTFNVPSFRFNNLYIDGVLRIDPDMPKTTIFARNIWIRGGKLAAGTESQVFDKQFEIILEGERTGEAISIDDLSRSGTKSLVVTGRLELYGITPSTTQTRLTAIVNPGDTQIQVKDDISDWNIGDKLVLGANKRSGSGFETVEIQSKDDISKTITLTTAVQYWHYGHQHVTVGTTKDSETQIDEKYGGDLDMRGTVGHITRNIKISGNYEESNWGGHLQFYHYKHKDDKLGIDIDARGSAHIQGVEFENMGQRGDENAGIHFLMTNKESQQQSLETKIIGSSIHNCNGMCVNGLEAYWVTFDNNVFYKGKRFHIQALDSKRWTITNNLFIGVLKREVIDLKKNKIWDPVAFIHMYTPYIPQEDDHNVYNNVGQGSEGIGYAFPGTPCQFKDDTRFKNNEAGHLAFTGVLFNLKHNECYHVGYVGVYNAEDGVNINSSEADDGYDAEQIRVAECETNIILHTGSFARLHNNFVRNSWVSALARPSCTECYAEERILNLESRCAKGNGFQLHVTTIGGESFPWEKNPLSYDVICNAPNAFGSVMMDDIELHNYKENYDNTNNAHLAQCSGNRGFRNHGSAASGSASHYLRNVKCRDCEQKALAFIMEPLVQWRGWFGGCGNFDCTGLENMLIQDITGDFLGHEGSIVSNNEAVTMNSEYFGDKCTFYESMNAYDCVSTEFGVLEWDAIGSDKQELNPVPVYVANDYFNNTINLWREWEWQGPEPLNMRLNRFLSLVTIGQIHNITYSGTQCSDMIHKLAQRSKGGEIDRFIIIQYHYTSSLALEVEVNNKIIEPWPLNNQQDLIKNNKTDCGANNYFYANNTIHFVVTNEANCHVRVYQKNQVQISLRIKMTPEQFYNEPERVGHFSNLLASFLGIDYSQIRIVGLKSFRRLLEQQQQQQGGSELQFIVLGDQPGDPKEGYKADESYVKLKECAKKIEDGLADKSIDLGFEATFGEVQVMVIKKAGITVDESSFMTDEDLVDRKPETEQPVGEGGGEEKEEKDSVIVITLGVIFGVIGTVIIAVTGYHYWKKNKIKGIDNVPQQEEYTINEKGMYNNNKKIHNNQISLENNSPEEKSPRFNDKQEQN